MSNLFILQRFAAGEAAAFDHASTLAFLARYGEIGRGLADQELCFADPDLASNAILVGDESSGIACILIEEPKAGPAFRAFVFAAIETLDACAFDDELRAIYLHQRSIGAVPAALAQASLSGVHQVISAQQIWPADLALPAPSGLRYAAMLDNPNPQGRPYQILDALSEADQVLRYDFHTHPLVCGPAVCRGLRQIMLRIELVRRRMNDLRGSAWRAELAFQHHDAFLAIMEAPAPASLPSSALTVTALPGVLLDPGRNAFSADLDRVATAEWNAQRCAHQAHEEFGLAPCGGLAGAQVLDQLLQAVHQRVAANRDSDFAGELIRRWSWFAGSAFGEIIRFEVGAQWGTLPLGHSLHPALRLHSGRHVFPLLRVLDKLHRGDQVSLAKELQELIERARSRVHQLGGYDEVAALPGLFGFLVGQQIDAETPLPEHRSLATAELDGSPQSLQALDRWLLKLAPIASSLPRNTLNRAVRCAGAYLGEVISRSDPKAWLWENHHDYFDGTPGLPDVDYGLQSAVVLRGHGTLLFPYSEILRVVMGDAEDGLLAWARRTAPGFAAFDDYLQQQAAHGAGPGYARYFTPISAPVLAKQLQAEHPELDGDLPSVTDVDRLIAALRDEELPAQVIAQRAGRFACYLGELAVRHYGARWQVTAKTRLGDSSSSPIVLETAAGSVVDPFGATFLALRVGARQRIERLLVMIDAECRVLATVPADAPTGAPPAPDPARQQSATQAAPSAQRSNPADADVRRQNAERAAAAILAQAQRAAPERRPGAGNRFSWTLLLVVAPMGGLFAAAVHSTGAGVLFAALAAGGALWLRRAG